MFFSLVFSPHRQYRKRRGRGAEKGKNAPGHFTGLVSAIRYTLGKKGEVKGKEKEEDKKEKRERKRGKGRIGKIEGSEK